jgi:hypothetical protein
VHIELRVLSAESRVAGKGLDRRRHGQKLLTAKSAKKGREEEQIQLWLSTGEAGDQRSSWKCPVDAGGSVR